VGAVKAVCVVFGLDGLELGPGEFFHLNLLHTIFLHDDETSRTPISSAKSRVRAFIASPRPTDSIGPRFDYPFSNLDAFPRDSTNVPNSPHNPCRTLF
jgi:hypothetical protein